MDWTKAILLTTSNNPSPRVVASFAKNYLHKETEYHVLFEGKSKARRYPIETWQLTISCGRAAPSVYVFRKLGKDWVGSADMRQLPVETEMALLPWAAANIAMRIA